MKAITDGPVSRFRYFFVMLLTPSYDTFLNRVVASDGNRDGVFIGLALELYHREHGKWPESLGELSPKYLPTLPADPITGKPLHYKVVSDRPIVYSVGVDGDDDGGRLRKTRTARAIRNTPSRTTSAATMSLSAFPKRTATGCSGRRQRSTDTHPSATP